MTVLHPGPDVVVITDDIASPQEGVLIARACLRPQDHRQLKELPVDASGLG
jgi:hypothetical protein